jgi:hypothetical protein
MQAFTAKKNYTATNNKSSLFDGNNHGSQSMIEQEDRAKILYQKLNEVTDVEQIKSIENELFEIEKYCQAVNILLCGGI